MFHFRPLTRRLGRSATAFGVVLAVAMAASISGAMAETSGGKAIPAHESAMPGATQAATGVRNQVDDFISALAAAQVCRGVALSDTEKRRFVDFLSIRDTRNWSLQKLTAYTWRTLAKDRQAVSRAGCHSPAVGQELTTWDLRVTLLAGIEGSDFGAVEVEAPSGRPVKGLDPKNG